VKPPRYFALQLLESLAGKTCAFSMGTDTLERANALVTDKYATTAWLERT
jgi:hypothetical protein